MLFFTSFIVTLAFYLGLDVSKRRMEVHRGELKLGLNEVLCVEAVVYLLTFNTACTQRKWSYFAERWPIEVL